MNSLHQLDDIDITLLDILQKNGRTRRNDLAQAVDLSIPSVSERLKKLEENGIIIGYTTIIDPKKVGKDITAFITVTVDSSKHYNSFLDHAKTTDEILEIHSVTGTGTHLIKIRTENTSSLEKLLSKIQAWSGIVNTTTSIVLSTMKETNKLKINKTK
ncbi:MAG: Lrp/AsnC family transcriptional regulator [Bacteriovoracaceae bacterium]|nr:Lrp/AsnC family transcriptional regulator [Bacteroidota bacterium]